MHKSDREHHLRDWSNCGQWETTWSLHRLSLYMVYRVRLRTTRIKPSLMAASQDPSMPDLGTLIATPSAGNHGGSPWLRLAPSSDGSFQFRGGIRLPGCVLVYMRHTGKMQLPTCNCVLVCLRHTVVTCMYAHATIHMHLPVSASRTSRLADCSEAVAAVFKTLGSQSIAWWI